VESLPHLSQKFPLLRGYTPNPLQTRVLPNSVSLIPKLWKLRSATKGNATSEEEVAFFAKEPRVGEAQEA
jgi:hypothetical protein